MKIISVGNAKGGVGKSFIASNLALALCNLGHRTFLVDLDQSVSSACFWSLLDESSETGGNSQISENLTIVVRSRSNSDFDWQSKCAGAEFVIVDTGPGIDDMAVEAFGKSEIVILVSTPEPASILGLLKTAKAIQNVSETTRIALVTNQTCGPAAGARLAYRLTQKLGQQLSMGIVIQANIPFDPIVSDSVIRRQLIGATKPKCQVSKAIEGLALVLQDYAPVSGEVVLLPLLKVCGSISLEEAA